MHGDSPLVTSIPHPWQRGDTDCFSRSISLNGNSNPKKMYSPYKNSSTPYPWQHDAMEHHAATTICFSVSCCSAAAALHCVQLIYGERRVNIAMMGSFIGSLKNERFVFGKEVAYEHASRSVSRSVLVRVVSVVGSRHKNAECRLGAAHAFSKISD